LREHRYADAEQLERDTVQLASRTLGPEHPDALHYTNILADTLDSEHKYIEAESLTRRVYDAQRRVLGVADPDTAISAYSLGQLLLRRGQKEEGLPLLREGVLHGPLHVFAEIETEPDFKMVCGDPRFADIVALAKHRLNNEQASGRGIRKASPLRSSLWCISNRHVSLVISGPQTANASSVLPASTPQTQTAPPAPA